MVEVIIPGWASHDDADGSSNAIFSIDIHPDKTRFVTGGADFFLKIWNCIPLLSKTKKAQSDAKLLCSRNLVGAINCVRWCHSGKYLASASDEISGGIVTIWERKMGIGSSFGGEVSIENWRELRTFKGHKRDVSGICWSPDDSLIASCSIDNSINIWNVQGNKLITTITGHTGFVKGIAWDPIGKYLATQSDDNSVRIWRVENWEQIREISAPFESSLSQSHSLFSRLDWSPEGSHLVTTNSVNNGLRTAAILPRGNWQSYKEFVGHKKPVVCVKFNGKLFDDDNSLKSVCALGSMDGHISLWTSTSSKAILVLSNIFTACVQDLSWSSDGNMLMGCSTDGKVCVINFSDGELGTPITDDAKNQKIKQMYGDIIAFSSDIIENVDLLDQKRNRVVIKQEPMSGSDDEENLMEFIEKRRIMSPTPLFKNIPSPTMIPIIIPDDPEPSFPNYYLQKEEIIDGTRRITPLFLGKDQEIRGNLVENLPVDNHQAPQTVSQNAEKKEAPSTGGVTILQPKRITPVLISAGTSSKSDLPALKRRKLEDTSTGIEEIFDTLSKGTILVENLGNRLKVPKETATLLFTLDGFPSLEDTLSIQSNIITSKDTKAVRGVIQCYRNLEPNPCWEHLIDSKPAILLATDMYCIISTTNGYLYFLSTSSGRQMFTKMIIPSIICYLKILGDHRLLGITSDYQLYLWDISTQTCLVSETVKPALVNNSSIIDIQFSDKLEPIVYTHRNECFILLKTLNAWVLVNSQSISESASLITLPKSQKNEQLFKLQSKCKAVHFRRSASTQMQTIESIAYLNHQMACSIALQSRAEFKFWLYAIVKKLTTNGDSHYLRSICEDLFSGTFNTGAESDLILGFSREELLQDILSIVSASSSSNSQLQSLVEYFIFVTNQEHIETVSLF